MTRTRVALMAALALGAVWAAAPKFDVVPTAALQHLKGARGKPIRKGVVFVNGRYLPPPYTIWRRGTAIYVGDVQVTGQIVPWSAFMLAQGAGGGAAAPAAPKKAEEKKPVAAAKSVDDLFDDDEPAPKKSAGGAAAPEPEVGGPFTPNDKTKRYLKRIMDYRTDVDRRLRRGEILFFGTKYSTPHIEENQSMSLMTALSSSLREARDASDLQSRLRAQGVRYLSNAICEDLFANQALSFEIEERLRKMKDEQDTWKLIDAGAQGVVR